MEFDFLNFINTTGFPIAMVIYLLFDKAKLTKNLVDAIDNNTKVIAKFCGQFGLSEKGSE